jgi:cytosine/adenosine deaminase-related metal-dependent hydrolase
VTDVRVLRADWVVPVTAEPIADGAVAVAGGVILAVGRAADVLADHAEASVERYEGCVLAPGFVNLHTHLEYAGFGGFGDGLAFGPWLDVHIQRKGRQIEGDALALARLGAIESMRGGATTVVDASYAGAAVAAASELGLRAVVALEVFGGSADDPDTIADDLDARLARIGAAAGPLVELAVSPHAPYTVAPAVFQEVVRRARAHGRRVVTHIAESQHELDALVRGEGLLADPARRAFVAAFGRHPIAELAELGVLGPETVIAHAVLVDDAEVELLAASGASVAHCPRSNALLGCGVAPLAALRRAGIPVGIGTDGPSSALDLDCFAELRAAILLQRASSGDPAALGTGEALRLATMGGAEALGLADRIGSLEAGKRADLIAVRLDDTAFWPSDDPVAALVLAGGGDRVVFTMVEGFVRYGVSDDSHRAALVRARDARRRMLALPT